MPTLPPLFGFLAYEPSRTQTVRLAREAMWRKRAEAPPKKVKAKKDGCTTQSSKGKKREHPTLQTLSPEHRALLLSALSSHGLA